MFADSHCKIAINFENGVIHTQIIKFLKQNKNALRRQTRKKKKKKKKIKISKIPKLKNSKKAKKKKT